jgi:predicted nucleic acid-binding protein
VDAEEFLHIVVTDSSVIINFHHTSHLGLLKALPRLRFMIPEEVIAEITDPNQAQILNKLV